MKIVVDSYAWIEHFLGSEKGEKVDEVLKQADDIYTSDVVLAEIARKYAREQVEYEVIEARLKQIEEASSIVSLDTEIAVLTARSYLELEVNAKKLKLNLPSLFDAIILATGRYLEAKILTGDQHFKNLPETLWLE